MKISIYQKLGIQTLLIVNTVIITGARSNETQSDHQPQNKNTCQSDNIDSSTTTTNNNNCQQQQQQQQEEFDERQCTDIPNLEDLWWGELTPACHQYWIVTEPPGMIRWDREHFWDELHPLSQQYWLDLGNTPDEWEIEQFEWNDLPLSRQEYWKRRSGWNEDAWNVGDESLKTFINEEELDWDELSRERRAYWIERGYDKEKWESSVDYAGLEKIGRVFNPRKLALSIPQLEAITIDTLAEKFDAVMVGLRDGYTVEDNESYIGTMSIKDYVKELRMGSKKYLAMEDLDPYKKAFEDVVGGSVYEYMFEALNGSELREEGVFTPEEWDEEYYDWAMFAGSKGTSTSMHYDNDLFNFLYVTEGRKRIVLIPNDERTEGKFDIVSAFSGTAHTGLDILDRSKPLPELAVEIEIGPGEGIYFPYMCWHAVENMEDTLAFGWRVKDGY